MPLGPHSVFEKHFFFSQGSFITAMKIFSEQHLRLSLAFSILLNCGSSSSDFAINYLWKFGYLPKVTPKTGEVPQDSTGFVSKDNRTAQQPANGSSVSITEAVKTFQECAGLTATEDFMKRQES